MRSFATLSQTARCPHADEAHGLLALPHREERTQASGCDAAATGQSGGIEIWFGYVLVLFVLLVRPQGLFGEKIIDRV